MPVSRKVLQQSVAYASAQQVWKLQRIAEGKDPRVKPSGAFKRKCAAALQPCAQCFEEVLLGGIAFSVAKLDMLLAYVCHEIPAYKDAVLRANRLSFLWYCDEATGGNVLATSQSKKATLWYVAVYECGHFNSPSVWLPFCCIPSMDLSVLPGGFSAVTECLARRFEGWRRQGLSLCGKHFPIELKALIGDYDAICGVYSAVGATGVKPCLLCQNCVSKHQRDNLIHHHYFKPVTCFDFSLFQEYDFAELCETYDGFLQQFPRMTQTAQKEAQRLLGYTVDPRSLMASSTARQEFPLQKVLLDSMHIYFSNGIASRELLLMQAHWERCSGQTLEALLAAVLSDAWSCQNKRFRSPSALKKLFHPTFWQGSCYKGEATSVWFLLPLLGYYAALSPDGCGPELRAFEALLWVVRELKAFRRGCGSSERLAKAQAEHLSLFHASYGSEHVVPKHHLALHLPSLYQKLCYCDCFASEARHREYKQNLCDDLEGMLTEGTGKFSRAMMQRLLNRCVEKAPDCWDVALEGQTWSKEVLREVLGVSCEVSTGIRCKSLHLNVKDIIFLVDGRAGECLFFLKEGARFVVVCRVLEEIMGETNLRNSRQFMASDSVFSVPLAETSVSQPAWWRLEGNRFHCLL